MSVEEGDAHPSLITSIEYVNSSGDVRAIKNPVPLCPGHPGIGMGGVNHNWSPETLICKSISVMISDPSTAAIEDTASDHIWSVQTTGIDLGI